MLLLVLGWSAFEKNVKLVFSNVNPTKQVPLSNNLSSYKTPSLTYREDVGSWLYGSCPDPPLFPGVRVPGASHLDIYPWWLKFYDPTRTK